MDPTIQPLLFFLREVSPFEQDFTGPILKARSPLWSRVLEPAHPQGVRSASGIQAKFR